jgi:hypothetical protein
VLRKIFNPKNVGFKVLTVVSIIMAMMEAARTSETSVNFYQTTRRYNPEDSHLHNPKKFVASEISDTARTRDIIAYWIE